MSDPRLVTVPAGLQARFTGFRPVGTGGASSVYRARRRDSGLEVAIKLLREPEDEVARRRFLREAEALARIDHPSVVRIEESGVSDGVPFLVMELVPGDPMSRLPAGTDPLPGLLAIADGLEAVHRAGLVHRDVKPSNMVLTPGGRAVLVDFGLAFDAGDERLTMVDRVPGTLSYLAPERLGGAPPAASADWWAWGVSLYALCEGGLPFANHELFHAAAGADLPELRFTRLAPGDRRIDLVRACLSLDARRRPSRRIDLDRLLGGGPGKRGAGPGIRIQVAVGLVAALVAAGVGSRSMRSIDPGSPPRSPPTMRPGPPASVPDPESLPRIPSPSPPPEPAPRATRPAIPESTRTPVLEGPVEALAVDAKGRLVAAGPTGVAQLAAEGLALLARHPLPPAEGERRVALASDGSLLVLADGAGVVVIDPGQGLPVARMPPLPELPAGLAVSARGPIVFLSWNDGRVAALDPARPGSPRWTVRLGRRPFPLLPSPDGAYLVVAELGSLHLLDAATGAARGTYQLEAAIPPPLAFSPEGARLVAADAVGDLHLLTIPGLSARRLPSGSRRTPLGLALLEDRIAAVAPGPTLLLIPTGPGSDPIPEIRLPAWPRSLVVLGAGSGLVLGFPDGTLEKVVPP